MWIIGGAIVLELAFMCVVYGVSKHAWSNKPTPSDCIIVLGARVYADGQMSPTLLYRARKALELYQNGLAPTLIVCGAQGGDEPKTEADAMAAYLLEQGVPKDCVLLDTTSTDTHENLINAQALMTQHGMNTAIVVTSDYHLTRALWQSKDVGITASGAPAPGPDSPYKFCEAYFRETVSWVNYWTGGLIDKMMFWK